LDLTGFTGQGKVLTMHGISIGVGLVTVCLAGLSEQYQRGGVGCLQAEGKVQQDEGINIKVKDPHALRAIQTVTANVCPP
jgi:hypothetical protein